MSFARQLHQKVEEVCPIDSVAVGRKGDRNSWRLDFKPEATEAQKAAARDVMARFAPWDEVDAVTAPTAAGAPVDLGPIAALLKDMRDRLDALEIYATKHIHVSEDGKPMAFVEVGPDGHVKNIIADTRTPVDAP